MKRLHLKSGQYYYPLSQYSLARVLSFERFQSYVRGLPSGDLVLDYGAGDRPYEEMLRKKFSNYLAADYAGTHAEYYGGKEPDILLTNTTIPLESASVDCAVLTEVLEHVYDPRTVLMELNRILKSGGWLVGTVPFAIQHHDEPYDFHRYTYYCLKRLFEDSGFRIQNVDYVGDLLGVYISISLSILDLFPRMLEKVRLAWLAFFIRGLFRLPAFAYYYARKLGLDPGRVRYFRRFPLGFAFRVWKP